MPAHKFPTPVVENVAHPQQEVDWYLLHRAKSPALPTILPALLRAGFARAAAVSHVRVSILDNAGWNGARPEKDGGWDG